LLFYCLGTAFATPNDDAITALKNAKVPETYIIQAQNYLKTTTLTAEESTAVVAQITEAAAILEASGQTDITKLSDADKNAIVANIVAAGEAIDLTVTVTKASNGQYAIVATDASGTTVINFASNDVKQTGMNSTIIFAGMLLVMLAAGSVFVLRRNNLQPTA
jgi:LPXTG-motif cell wall-anchored protein